MSVHEVIKEEVEGDLEECCGTFCVYDVRSELKQPKSLRILFTFLSI